MFGVVPAVLHGHGVAPSTLLGGLAAYYALESGADALGASGLTNNGGATFTPGKYGKAGTFAAGSSQYLSRASSAVLQAGDIDLTIDCFVRLTSTSGAPFGLVCKADGGLAHDEYRLVYTGANRFRFVVSDGNTNQDVVDAGTFGALTVGIWYYVRCWRDKSQGKIFISVNNGAADSTVQTVTPGTNGTAFTIGATATGINCANAQIDEVGIWKRLLTAGEAAARYNGGLGSTWPFAATVPPDIFIIAGQSNAEGQGTNNQAYSGAVQSWLFGNDYVFKTLCDPTDDIANQVDAVSLDAAPGGSYWPLLATSIAAATHRPTIFVPCALSATSMAQWQPGADHQDRTTLYGSMVYRINQVKALGHVRAVLWHQGEKDARADTATPQATYDAGLDTIANTLAADVPGINLMPCKLQQITDLATYPQAGQDRINAAIAAAWGDNPNVLTGPDLTGLTADNTDGLGVHLISDANLAGAAGRWWTAIRAAFGW